MPHSLQPSFGHRRASCTSSTPTHSGVGPRALHIFAVLGSCGHVRHSDSSLQPKNSRAQPHPKPPTLVRVLLLSLLWTPFFCVPLNRLPFSSPRSSSILLLASPSPQFSDQTQLRPCFHSSPSPSHVQLLTKQLCFCCLSFGNSLSIVMPPTSALGSNDLSIS